MATYFLYCDECEAFGGTTEDPGEGISPGICSLCEQKDRESWTPEKEASYRKLVDRRAEQEMREDWARAGGWNPAPGSV
jgi:hypothetical protein